MMDENFAQKLRFKVDGGTTRGDADLCRTCNFVFLRKGAHSSAQDAKECTYSNQHHIRIDGPIAECSKYEPKGLPDLWDLKKIAWVIDSDRKTGKVGFMSPKEWRKVEHGED